jgi:hypothetical protein
MPYGNRDYSNADPTDQTSYTFDFTAALAAGETISTATCAISVAFGVDANPSSHLVGSAVVSANGANVSQLIGGLLVGVKYRIEFTANTSGSQKILGHSFVTCTLTP